MADRQLARRLAVSSAGWRNFRQQGKRLGDLAHALGLTFAEKQARPDVDVLWPVEESENDDGLLVRLDATLVATQFPKNGLISLF